jgi:uncharacterized tellurite resistance protein B-like protein
MLFRRFLGGDVAAADPGDPGDGDPRPEVRVGSMPAMSGETATVRRIVERLEALPDEQARYLAGFAYVMSRAAHADLEISSPETRAMEQFVTELGGLDEAQAVLVVEMAKLQTRHHGATEDFLVTREFGRRATLEQKLALLRCCFAVGAADETISAEESGVVNQIANELDIERDDLNRVRSEFHERLSTIQAMRRMAAAD